MIEQHFPRYRVNSMELKILVLNICHKISSFTTWFWKLIQSICIWMKTSLSMKNYLITLWS